MPEIQRRKDYVHEKLWSPTKSIRLLTLDIETEEHVLAGTLGVYPVDPNLKYIAVSYEWGQPYSQKAVLINGKTFPIRQNLWQLLRELKNRIKRGKLATDVRIWIDAICIDQEDHAERNQQVSVMGQIFRSAIGVLAWLGLPDDWTPSRTFEFMRSRPWIPKGGGQTHHEVNGVRQLPSHSSNSELWTPYPELWMMVLSMCRCRYWSRRWVVQELLLAKDVTIICGEAEIDWVYLMRMLHGLDTVQWPNSSYAKTIERIKATLPIMMSRYTAMRSDTTRFLYQPNDHSLMDLVTDFQTTDCEITHDKIYSLLSLAREGVDISVDYECSPEDLIANLFVKVGWSEPEHVTTIAIDLGLSENIPYRFGGSRTSSDTTPYRSGGPGRRLHGTDRSVQSLPAVHRITHCHWVQGGFDGTPVKDSEVEHLEHLFSITKLCISADFLRRAVGQYKSSGKSFFARFGALDPAKLAVCEDGSTAIVCSTAQTGDYICRFRKTVLVVRSIPEQLYGHQTFSVTGTACVVILKPERSSILLQELIVRASEPRYKYTWEEKLISALRSALPSSLGGSRDLPSPHRPAEYMLESSLFEEGRASLVSPAHQVTLMGAFAIWELIEFSRNHTSE